MKYAKYQKNLPFGAAGPHCKFCDINEIAEKARLAVAEQQKHITTAQHQARASTGKRCQGRKIAPAKCVRWRAWAPLKMTNLTV